MPSKLIEFWRRFTPSAPPYVHPDDWEVLRLNDGRHIDVTARDFEGFVKSDRFGGFEDTRFHLSLLPQPYGGNLNTADILILLLNPGFSFTDYFGEYSQPAFRRHLEKMIAQDFQNMEFPFIWLNPEHCWHGGFNWWERKLRDVARVIAVEQFGGKYLDALRSLSQRLAHIELVPYHSPSFKAHRLIEHLPSVRAAKAFAERAIVAAHTGGKTIIVTRQAAAWNIHPNPPNIIVYEGGMTRGASMGVGTSGGRAILARYGILAAPQAGESVEQNTF